MIINASKMPDISTYIREMGIACSETLDVDGQAGIPVILSDHRESDPTCIIANNLVASGTPVLYLAYHSPTNLSPEVTVITGAEVKWSEVEGWIRKLTTRAISQAPKQIHPNEKNIIACYGITPSAGDGHIARALAVYSAIRGVKTLLIDVDFRFPKAPYVLGYHHATYNLDSLLEKLVEGERPHMEPYFLHKSKMDTTSKKRRELMKHLPDHLYVISPSIERGMEHFPSLGNHPETVTEIIEKLIDAAKPHFDTIIFSMGSDPDEVLNVSVLRAVQTKLFVLDVAPSSVLLFPQRKQLLNSFGVKMDSSYTILNKLPSGQQPSVFEQVIGQSIDVTIGSDPHLTHEVVQLNWLGGETFRTGIQEAARKILGLEIEPKKEVGVWKHLRGLITSVQPK